MTLDEAIKHCEDKVIEMNKAKDVCIACAQDHMQLAEWLKDYKRLLSLGDGFVPYPLFEPAEYGEYLIAVQEDGVLHYDLGDWSEYIGSGGIHGACWVTYNDWDEDRQIVAWCALPELPKLEAREESI